MEGGDGVPMWTPSSFDELDLRWQPVAGPRGNPALFPGRLNYELGVGVCVLLAVMFIALGIGGKPVGFLFALFFLAGVPWCVNLLRAGLYVSQYGIKVINPLRTYRYPWQGTRFAFEADGGPPEQLVLTGSSGERCWVHGFLVPASKKIDFTKGRGGVTRSESEALIRHLEALAAAKPPDR